MNNTIRIQRAIKDISQEKLANDLGVHRQTIYGIEKNKYVPSVELALKIARYFGKRVEEIFSLDDGEQPVA
jgi:putative transcriptional regulator